MKSSWLSSWTMLVLFMLLSVEAIEQPKRNICGEGIILAEQEVVILSFSYML